MHAVKNIVDVQRQLHVFYHSLNIGAILQLKTLTNKLGSTREPLKSLHANNKGADQSAHPRSLVSVVGIRSLVRTIFKLSPSEVTTVHLVSVAEQSGMCLTCSKS